MADNALQSESDHSTEVLRRLESTLRTIRVLQSAPSTALIGSDAALVNEWKRRCIERLEDVVEECIGLLDELHGDPDMENDDPAEVDDEGPDYSVLSCRPLGSGTLH